jgi:hypothetical protein
MKSVYQESQRQKAINFIQSKNPIFEGAKGGKSFFGIPREFVLFENMKNLFSPIRNIAHEYFEKNGIPWWGGIQPTGHVLSSQIACLNHLFQLRDDKDAVLSLLKSISTDFNDVLKIVTDKFSPSFIQFESVSDIDHLKEKKDGIPSRGANCTSIDALIYAVHNDGSKWIIPIEWKYTEFYNNQNKAIEGFLKNPVDCKGEVRKKRYTDLINHSKQLKSQNHLCYYFEPFYQLMRQTLWAEQMIENQKTESIKADNYLHVHVIPAQNEALLDKEYKCSGLKMEKTWRNHLSDQSKYLIVSPQNLMKGLNPNKYELLLNYLNVRYW